MSRNTFHIAVLILELVIPDAQSLKSRRQVLRSLKDRIAGQFHVSIAEIGETEKWQRSTLGICCIGNEKAHLDATLQKIITLVASEGNVMITRQEIQFI